MKKILWLSTLSLLFISCATDDNNNSPDPNITATYSLSIDGNFFVSQSSGILYISDSDGEIVGQGALANNQQTSLEVDFDPNEVYDASVFLEVETNGIQFYFLNTLTNVPPGNYNIPGLMELNPNDDTITINITNAGSNLEILSSSRFLNVDSNSNNGGTYILSGEMIASPGDYYVSLQKPGEQFPRYIWLEDITGNSNINLDFNVLPMINTSISVNIPLNESSSLSLWGMMDDDPQAINGVFHHAQYENTSNGTASYNAMVPQNVFDMYRISVGYELSNNENEYRYTTHSTNIPQNIPTVDLDFTVNNNTISNFSMSTQGSYDYFQANFSYSNITQDVIAQHDIVGAAASAISFSKANLFDNVFANDPDINSGMLAPSDSYGLTNYSQFSGYSGFINSGWIYGPALMNNEYIENVAR